MHNHHHSANNPFHPAGQGAAFRAHHASFGRHGFKPPFGPGGHAQMMAAFAGHGGRARRGDLRAAALRLLAEEPMHGYQMIQLLAERTEGAWSPSAGSIYPTLQMLADEGLISAEETGGKKVYSLTEAGKAAVAEIADQPAPWETPKPSGVGNVAYREASGKLMQAIWQLGTTGSAEQTDAAVEVITEARKKLYAILAED